ncbi:putative hydrolase [Legionella oakridgensis RV-2-2007]|uniref:Alpha/beta hydrolase n=3 Tax=Legionella oakridgensis TaxID=29423 RepID=A0A0W0WXP2_9GAMM|nr:putative hydrolase [Legionella oakridgensis RV-2-2007]KTD37087.1 alpha/beta hydrolase [Legionella oakridgensis]
MAIIPLLYSYSPNKFNINFMSIPDFKPNLLVRNKHLQTILSSKKRPVFDQMIKNEQLINLKVETDEIVHLNGCYSPHVQPVGLVILLHGWLGCVRSSYMLARGEQLYKKGYSVFRLNMRDHGQTVALNEGIFHGCRLEEVFQAVKQIAELKPELPVSLVGFSMGGSFALRVGWRQSITDEPIKNLKKIIAICPSVNPEQVTDAIDKSKIYRHYFCNRWRNNLIEKQKCFPELYDFSDLLSMKSCKQITAALIEKYSDFPDMDAYFSEYHFSQDKLRMVNIPMTVLAAADDPVIPIDGFSELKNINSLFNLNITDYGGHVGYINTLMGDSWLDMVLPTLMATK